MVSADGAGFADFALTSVLDSPGRQYSKNRRNRSPSVRRSELVHHFMGQAKENCYRFSINVHRYRIHCIKSITYLQKSSLLSATKMLWELSYTEEFQYSCFKVSVKRDTKRRHWMPVLISEKLQCYSLLKARQPFTKSSTCAVNRGQVIPLGYCPLISQMYSVFVHLPCCHTLFLYAVSFKVITV